MLLQINSRKAIGIHPRLTLFVRDPVELAECLAERLPDARRKNALAPAPQFRSIRGERMPQSDLYRVFLARTGECVIAVALFSCKTQRISGFVVYFSVAPHTGALPAFAIAEDPDHPPSQKTEQRMLDIVLSPVSQR